MSTYIGMYMKSAGFETDGIHWFDRTGLSNLNEVCIAFAGQNVADIEVLVKWQRQSEKNSFQNKNGEEVADFPMWADTREFTLSSLFDSGIKAAPANNVAAEFAKLGTQASIQNFLQNYFAAAINHDIKVLVFWGHSDGPGSVVWMMPIEWQSIAQRLLGMKIGLGNYLRDFDPDLLQIQNIPLPTATATKWLDLLELEAALVATSVPPKSKLDFICLDACQNATLELAVVLENHCEIMIANQSSTPLAGWPYAKWPKALINLKKADIEVAACNIVGEYDAMGRKNSVISAVRLKSISKVVFHLGKVSNILLNSWSTYSLLLDLAAENSPVIPDSFSDKRDIITLFSQLRTVAAAALGNQHELVVHCDAIVSKTVDAIVARTTKVQLNQFAYNGLSIYLPSTAVPMTAQAAVIYAEGTPDFAEFKAKSQWGIVVLRYVEFLKAKN